MVKLIVTLMFFPFVIVFYALKSVSYAVLGVLKFIGILDVSWNLFD